MNKFDFRGKRIHILDSFHPKGSIAMNTSRKHENAAEQNDESIPPTGAGDDKKKKKVHRGSDERRLGFDRRCFSYTVYIPERRSGRDRRGLASISLSSYQQ